MILIRIGGVPEHFNLPWHLLLEARAAAQLGIEARWQDFPEGSGAMAAALGENRLDLAMLLTEGAIAGAAVPANGFKLVSLYTESPLIWGIHVPAHSELRSVSDIRGKRYAISRRGSGSHLMSFVHAREQGWPTDNLDFVVVRDMQGAIDAFAASGADVFFWEKFMTKPAVDSGRFRRVGEFVAPWPAFVVCVSNAALAQHGAALTGLVQAVCKLGNDLAARGDAAELIARRYRLQPEDARAWLSATRWASKPGIAAGQLARAVEALRDLGLIDRSVQAGALIEPLPTRSRN
jgi:ABC-type nitrate/sulfonate/bicarbonate transport system substrate-binding protein